MVVWAGCSDLVRDALGLWLQNGGASPLQLLFSPWSPRPATESCVIDGAFRTVKEMNLKHQFLGLLTI